MYWADYKSIRVSIVIIAIAMLIIALSMASH